MDNNQYNEAPEHEFAPLPIGNGCRLQSEIDILKVDSLSGEQLVPEALDLHARWPTMTPDEKRRVVDQMVRRIEIGDGEAHMHPSNSPATKNL